MWGAGRVEWEADLAVGDQVTRTSSVLRSKATDGRTGPLLLVTVEHLLRRGDRAGEVVLREEQSLVYRTPGPVVPLPDDAPLGDAPELSEDWTPTPALLFRFSAVTFNSHRIHYDEAYARQVEGYPALVVHGPLTAMRLAGLVEARLGRRLASFEFKAVAPLFVGCRARLVVEPADRSGDVGPGDDESGDGGPGDDGAGEGTARVVRNDGTPAVIATYRVRSR